MARALLAVALVLLAGCAAPSSQPGGAPPAPVPPPGGLATGWELLPDLEVQRLEATAAAAGGRIYLVGGIYEAGDTEATRVDVFDPLNGTWSEGPRLPVPLHHAPVVAAGPRVFVLGGYASSARFTPTAQTLVLDTSQPAPRWEAFTPLPSPRGAHAAAADGRTLWVFGGVTATGPAPAGLGQPFLDPTAWALDLQASPPSWRPLPNLPDPRDHLAAAFAEGKVYAIGGRDLTLASNTGRVDVFDPSANAWSPGPGMPTARGGLGAAVVGSRVVVAGGEAPERAFDTVEVLDAATGAWAAGSPLAEPRHGIGMAAAGGSVFVLAGGADPGFSYSGTVQRLRAG